MKVLTINKGTTKQNFAITELHLAIIELKSKSTAYYGFSVQLGFKPMENNETGRIDRKRILNDSVKIKLH
jgi:hypothetical protein